MQSQTSEYRGYRGLPPLAGICTMQEAIAPGLSVDACVDRLKRLHYVLKRLHEIFNARITAEPVYELKMAFSRHSYLCAEHVAALRTRVGELREPPLGLEEIPHDALKLMLDEVLNAPTTESLVVGLYGQVVPAVIATGEKYIAETHPLADAPSVRLLRIALMDLSEIDAFGREAIDCLVVDRDQLAPWEALLQQARKAAGGLDGTKDAEVELPEPMHSRSPYEYDRVPRRDERFVDPYNAGVDPEAFLYDKRFLPRDKTLMMYYKRLREIDVPEMMAGILHETPDQPWQYYLEMSRQVWDESRHAMMGEIGFASLGVDWTALPINFTWSLNLNTQLDPAARHAVLFFIEQSLMPKTGKRYEWEVARQSGEPLSALFQDFDWADEVLHAAIGRRWYVKDFQNLRESLDYGEKCWNRVMNRWDEYRRQGLTEHRNWWPQLYRAACRHWGVEPDPKALAFRESYEDADNLKGNLGVGADV